MSAPIVPVSLANPSASIQAPTVFPAAGSQAGASAFQSMFNGAINNVQSTQDQANTAIQNFLSGNTEDVHTTVLATQKADLTFELFMQVRNKVISAYQEIMRMQV
jgi:flagellar hook-basal body complex protein FliE